MNRLPRFALVALALLVLLPRSGAGDPPRKPPEVKLDTAGLFKKLDSNGDQRLSKEEYLAFVERLVVQFKDKAGVEKAGEFREKSSKAFDALNRDKKGLSLEQFAELLKSQMRPRAEVRSP